ncbi:MAG TPA: hypothetical protein VGC37_11720, partial [Friedmanniella sp.]
MLLCAFVGLVLVATGAWAVPRPADLARGQEQVHAVVPTTSAPPSATPSAIVPASSSPTTRVQGVAVPDHGPGTYDEAHVAVDSSTDRGRLYRFDVRVEKGLDLDPDTVA